MLKILQRVEDRIATLEGSLLTIIVLVMLALAVYNVFYRNILVPIQARVTISAVATSEAPPTEPSAESNSQHEAASESSQGDPEPTDGDGFGGGFGGGFGDDAEPKDEPADDPGEGFGGGFGGGFGETDEPKDDSKDDSKDEPVEGPGEGFGGGFGGGFGSDDPSDGSEGFGGGFGGETETGLADPPAKDAAPSDTVQSERAEPSAFVQSVDRFVLALRVEWIDVLLRHLVLICGFLGAMLATRRRKHITIDALSKVLPPKVLPYADGVTAALSAFICVVLAISGWDFVKIALEFRKELTWWADEWVFQLVFPIGFGLLAFHFLVRVAESVGEVMEAKS